MKKLILGLKKILLSKAFYRKGNIIMLLFIITMGCKVDEPVIVANEQTSDAIEEPIIDGEVEFITYEELPKEFSQQLFKMVNNCHQKEMKGLFLRK